MWHQLQMDWKKERWSPPWFWWIRWTEHHWFPLSFLFSSTGSTLFVLFWGLPSLCSVAESLVAESIILLYSVNGFGHVYMTPLKSVGSEFFLGAAACMAMLGNTFSQKGFRESPTPIWQKMLSCLHMASETPSTIADCEGRHWWPPVSDRAGRPATMMTWALNDNVALWAQPTSELPASVLWCWAHCF